MLRAFQWEVSTCDRSLQNLHWNSRRPQKSKQPSISKSIPIPVHFDHSAISRSPTPRPPKICHHSVNMSGEKRPASSSFGTTQLVKRQRSDVNMDGTVTRVNGSGNGALVQGVSPNKLHMLCDVSAKVASEGQTRLIRVDD